MERIVQAAAVTATAAGEARREFSLKIGPAFVVQREEEQRTEAEGEGERGGKRKGERNAKREEFMMKKRQHKRNISQDMNIPKLNTDQMLRVKKSLRDLFQKENNRSLN
jgi:hypothetical protein